MAVEHQSTGTSIVDVLDRVLDKGIVIDAWVRVSVVGIDLITIEARVVVASIQTYLQYADVLGYASSPASSEVTSSDSLSSVSRAFREAKGLNARIPS